MSKPKPPPFTFARDLSTSSFFVSPQTYFLDHPDSEFEYIATGALVFESSGSKGLRILLLQRSAHDSSPNCWEIPGGACDDDDETILHGVARELWEESGLVATRIGPAVGDAHRFVTRSGRQIGKFIFFVDVEKNAEGGTLEVKLCSDEHQRFVWATEEDVKALKAGDAELEFTTKDLQTTVLEAFKSKRNGD